MSRAARRRRPAALLPLLLLPLGCRSESRETREPAPAEATVAIRVARVARGSTLARAGIEPGDRLLRWRRGTLGGPIAGFDDLDELEREQAPRGPVTLVVERAGREVEAEIPAGRWRAQARPVAVPDPGPDPEPAVLERLRDAAPHEVVRAWAAWRLAGASAEPAAGEDWTRAVNAARAAGDPGLEAWLEAERCDALAHAAAFDLAEAACRRAAGLREQLGTPLVAAEVHYRQARLAGRRGDPAEEERRFRALLAELEPLAPASLPVARALQGLAKSRATQDDLEEAFAVARRALEICARRAPGGLDHQASLMLLGIFHWFVQDWDRAEARLSEGLALLEAIDPEHEDVANALNNLGLVAAHRGDLATAEHYYRRSLEVRERVAPDPLQASRTMTNLATVLSRRGDLEGAVSYDRRVLGVRERIAPESIDAATPLLNLGEELVELGRFDEAAPLLERALALHRQHAPASRDVASSLGALAELRLRRGDAPGAESLYAEALEVVQGPAPRTVIAAQLERGLGQARIARGALDGAEAPLRRSVELFEELAPGTLDAALSLHELGSLERTRGRTQQALAHFRAAAAALDRQLGALGGSDEVRARFRASWRHVYRDLADLLLERGRPDEAFEVLERSRSRAFLLMLRAREVEIAHGLPAELELERRQIGAEDDALQAQLAERSAAGDRESVERLASERRELQRRRDRLGEQVARARPRLAELDAALDPARALGALGGDVAAIAYTVEETNSRAWILAPAAGLRVVELGVDAAELRDLVDRFRLLLETPEPAADLRPLGRRLYRLLVAPAEASLAESDRLLVVPDGPLHHLPFAALVRDGADGADYLVEWKSLQFAASVTAWAELRRRHRREDGRLVAFADPLLPADGLAVAGLRGGSPAALPGSRREARAIAALFGDAATVLTGADASEPAAKRIGGEARILHFATHALIDPVSPLDSALLLAPARTPSGRLDNGLLQAWEVIQDLRLDADLVTLSACESGEGALVADEGVLGLTRAFQFAGARAVLASLWRVSDRETAELMQAFYRELLAGRPADEALRYAQLELSHRPGTLPAHWAGFELFGAAVSASAFP